VPSNRPLIVSGDIVIEFAFRGNSETVTLRDRDGQDKPCCRVRTRRIGNVPACVEKTGGMPAFSSHASRAGTGALQ